MPSCANLENPTFSYQNEASNPVSPMRRLEGMDWGALGDPDFNLIVIAMGLDWGVGPWRERASVMRCDHNINQIARPGIQHSNWAVDMFPRFYRVDDVLGAFVTNVDGKDVWYKRASGGETNLLEALIASSRVGLGFIGDVNMGAFSQGAMVAMCQWHSLLVR